MLARIVAFASASLLFVSSTATGLHSLGGSIGDTVDQVRRDIRGHYTERPTKPYLGPRPSHDPRTRGGLWTEQNLADMKLTAHRLDEEEAGLGVIWESEEPRSADPQSASGERALSPSPQEAEPTPTPNAPSPTPAAPQSPPHTLSVNPGAGKGNSWEGNSGSPGSLNGSVNPGNGNKLTSVPLVSWKARGGMTVDFTLYHNSQTSYNDELGYGWTWTYDIYINTSGSTATVHWGDGTSIPFTAGLGGAYTSPAGVFDSLVKNGNNTWTLTKKHGTIYTFNTSGFCTAITDRNGNSITLTLNGSNYCTMITDPSGRQIEITLDGSNNFTGIEDPLGRTWSFTRNGSDDLTTVTHPTLNATSYTDAFAYSSHDITSHTDRRGKVWGTTYNVDGSVASETNPLNKTWSYSYASGVTTLTNPLTRTTVYNYSSGILSSVVDKASFSESYTSRNTNKQVTAKTDRRGKSWSYTYDSRGNLLTVTDPLSHTTEFTWSTPNDLLTVENHLGHTTTYTYSSTGNRLTTTNPLSDVVADNTYDSYGQLLTFENALGKKEEVNSGRTNSFCSVRQPGPA